MKLSEVKESLAKVNEVRFQLPNGELIPSHFHVTEVGKISKNFIDCGGTVRSEELVNFQLWTADDVEHNLQPKKLIDIITLSEKALNIDDLEVEAEYQGDTIQKFALEFNAGFFTLINKQTDCLAPNKCGVKVEKPRIRLSGIGVEKSCEPGSGCC